MKDQLSKYEIHVMKALMSNKMTLLRVYPYESHVRDIIWRINDRREDKSTLCQRLLDIRKYADRYNINDNKIVIQLEADGYMIFIGYWDSYITIGTAVQPCAYAAKEFPKNDRAMFGPGLRIEF